MTSTQPNQNPCDEVQDLLYLFVTQELSPEEVEMVARHLGTCPACQGALVQHMQLAKHLGQSMASVPINYLAANA